MQLRHQLEVRDINVIGLVAHASQEYYLIVDSPDIIIKVAIPIPPNKQRQKLKITNLKPLIKAVIVLIHLTLPIHQTALTAYAQMPQIPQIHHKMQVNLYGKKLKKQLQTQPTLLNKQSKRLQNLFLRMFKKPSNTSKVIKQEDQPEVIIHLIFLFNKLNIN